MSEVVGIDFGGTKVAGTRLDDGQLGDSLVEHTRSSATALLELDEVDGLLVGEASLRADSFAAIVDAERRVSTGGRGRPR